MKRQFVFLFVLLLFTGKLYSQVDFTNYKFDLTKKYLVELQDETEFVANIIMWDSISVTIKTLSIAKLTIPLNRIVKFEEIQPENLKDGKYWFKNPHASRYLFAPSGYNLKKGEAYYQNAWLFLNSFNYGVTDYFSIGGGLELISTFTGNPIFFLTPKFGFEINEKINVGGGVIFASIIDVGVVGITYGIMTYGSEDHNITGGLGWGFFDGDISSKPIVVFSGVTRVGKKIALVTENWIIPVDGYYGLFSYGVRIFGKTMAVDLAFINNPDIAEGIGIGIPYVDFVVKF